MFNEHGERVFESKDPGTSVVALYKDHAVISCQSKDRIGDYPLLSLI